ncbi:mannitol dehydrogenase family protein [Algibacillus agarilyticus]|uniref:mannitol dehydrogenase family protein n=1 Tax=Algibacillus agarilyticus TaxID=2234133 RepID=UPI000DCF957D|nr:mannitol dehydrogenase family protein [Algibacillus agarilyticus]
MKLNKSTLTQLQTSSTVGLTCPEFDRNTLNNGIVHLGLGAFHRSHQALFTEKTNNLSSQSTKWGITGIAFTNRDLQAQLAEQDYLYTVAICDREESFQIIGSLQDVLVAKYEITRVVDAIVHLNTKLVTLTVTEKGYCLDSNGELDKNLPAIQADLTDLSAPRSAVGILVAALLQRFKAGSPSFNVIACDNLPHNGTRLKQAVVQFAACISSELANWIETNTLFPNTMVDCITPSTTDETLKSIEQQLDFSDSAPVQREAFDQWVIEDVGDYERPAWEEAGVIFTKDVAAFENAKLRVLNGLHSTLAYAGSLAGHKTVYEAVSNPLLEQFLVNLLSECIIPSLKAPAGLNLEQYANDILNRFKNPKIAHLLEQIAGDGSQKIPVRIVTPLIENLAQDRAIEPLCDVVCAWILFVQNKAKTNETLNDPRADDLLAAVNLFNGDAEHDIAIFININGLFNVELMRNETFIQTLTARYSRFVNGFDVSIFAEL